MYPWNVLLYFVVKMYFMVVRLSGFFFGIGKADRADMEEKIE